MVYNFLLPGILLVIALGYRIHARVDEHARKLESARSSKAIATFVAALGLLFLLVALIATLEHVNLGP